MRFFEIIKNLCCKFVWSSNFLGYNFQSKNLSQSDDKVFLKVMKRTVFGRPFTRIWWIRKNDTLLLWFLLLDLFLLTQVDFGVLSDLFRGSKKAGRQNFRNVLRLRLFGYWDFLFNEVLILLRFAVFGTEEWVEWVHNWVEIFFIIILVYLIDLKNIKIGGIEVIVERKYQISLLLIFLLWS